MAHARRVLYALSLSVLSLVLPVSTYAGGGAGVGGGGVSGLVIYVDHTTTPGHTYSFLDFFPRMAYVHQGEVVTFIWVNNPNALHTVSFLPKGVAPTNTAINTYFPGASNPSPDDDNPKQQVFHFNVHQAACGNSPYFPGTAPCTYDGSAPISSGFLTPALNPRTQQPVPGAPPAQWVVRITAAPGDYHWLCLVHGGLMSGTIRVVPAGAAIPSLFAQAQSAARQYYWGATNAVAHENQTAAHLPPPTTRGGHTTWNVMAGDQYGRVEIDEFFPRLTSVRAGDSVNWLPGGFHTVSSTNFNQPALAPVCDIGPRDVPFQGRFAGCNLEVGFGPAMFPLGKSGQAWTGQPMNSGNLVVPQPRTWSVSVPKAGTYQYLCLVHANMVGTIAVH